MSDPWPGRGPGRRANRCPRIILPKMRHDFRRRILRRKNNIPPTLSPAPSRTGNEDETWYPKGYRAGSSYYYNTSAGLHCSKLAYFMQATEAESHRHREQRRQSADPNFACNPLPVTLRRCAPQVMLAVNPIILAWAPLVWITPVVFPSFPSNLLSLLSFFLLPFENTGKHPSSDERAARQRCRLRCLSLLLQMKMFPIMTRERLLMHSLRGR